MFYYLQDGECRQFRESQELTPCFPVDGGGSGGGTGNSFGQQGLASFQDFLGNNPALLMGFGAALAVKFLIPSSRK